MKNKIDWQKRIVHSEDIDSFNLIVSSCEGRFSEVNEKLPWIEPSINMIHLDAVKSYVFGSSLSSISSSIFLLEHSLRMGIGDENNAGSTRKRPTKKIMNNTSWKSDESSWIPQKITYEAFFVQNWDFSSLKKSLTNYCRMAD